MKNHDATEKAYKNGYQAALMSAETLIESYIDNRTSVTTPIEFIVGLQRAKKSLRQ